MRSPAGFRAIACGCSGRRLGVPRSGLSETVPVTDLAALAERVEGAIEALDDAVGILSEMSRAGSDDAHEAIVKVTRARNLIAQVRGAVGHEHAL